MRVLLGPESLRGLSVERRRERAKAADLSVEEIRHFASFGDRIEAILENPSWPLFSLEDPSLVAKAGQSNIRRLMALVREYYHPSGLLEGFRSLERDVVRQARLAFEARYLAEEADDGRSHLAQALPGGEAGGGARPRDGSARPSVDVLRRGASRGPARESPLFPALAREARDGRRHGSGGRRQGGVRRDPVLDQPRLRPLPVWGRTREERAIPVRQRPRR